MKNINRTRLQARIGKVALSHPLSLIFACFQIETMLRLQYFFHTGGFKNIAIAEQTAFMKHPFKTMARIDLKTGCCSTGYFRNSEQIELVVDTIGNCLHLHKFLQILIMADNGKLYSGFTAEHAGAMKTHSADVIYPNITGSLSINRYAPILLEKSRWTLLANQLRNQPNLTRVQSLLRVALTAKSLTGVHPYTKKRRIHFDFL